jgi:folate-binding protein YgfZ
MAQRLEDRAVIALSGPDTRGFLQGLITNDVERLAPGKALYAALLTPQGKILFDFLIVEGDGAILLDCAADSRDALLKRLRMYRLRAKLDIEARDQLVVLAGLPDPKAGISFPDPRLAALGHRTIGSRAEMPAAADNGAARYLAHRLDLGVPHGADFGSDRMFALDAGLDELGAVSFDKGCYVGQELTARMKHRGTARKRLLAIQSLDGSALPQSDTSLKATGRDIGEITSTYGTRGFALVRLDRLEEAGRTAIDAGGVGVGVIKPSWLFA